MFAGSIEDGPLNRWLKQSPDATKLLNAPILVCTIDHLMPASESTRGGHQIPPMLHLMSSDLVLDEPDDFGIDDLPALSRLVHWAGLLGSRVRLSSAPLPPALIEGLFEAYRAGRAEFAKNRGRPQKSAQICCAWFDEFAAESSDHDTASSYRSAHAAFILKTSFQRRGADKKLRTQRLGSTTPFTHPVSRVFLGVPPLTPRLCVERFFNYGF